LQLSNEDKNKKNGSTMRELKGSEKKSNGNGLVDLKNHMYFFCD
jgi:hypothetical protein